LALFTFENGITFTETIITSTMLTFREAIEFVTFLSVESFIANTFSSVDVTHTVTAAQVPSLA
jgi:hypothetical protein